MEDLLIEIDWIVVGFFVIFFLAMALFYTLFITALFKIEIKPPWLLFALFPILLLTIAFINRKYVIITLLGLFALLAAILLIGKAYILIKDIIKTYKKRRRKKSKSVVIFEMLKNFIITAFALFVFFYDGKMFLLFFIILFVYYGFFQKNSKDSFLKLQASLPTSTIRSLAMGLVEIKGTTQIIEPLISRLKKKECIGYKYTIESRSKSGNRKAHYTITHTEVICNPFTIYDETGEVIVNGTDIDFIWLPIHHRYQSNNKRYTQYLLLPNQEVLLIGKATSKNNTIFIEKENINDIFTLALFNKITRWNINRPLIKSLTTFSIVFFILMALILMTNFVIKDNTIYLNFDDFNFSIQQIINTFKK